MNVAHEEVISVNTVVKYDMCPFKKLFLNLLPYTQSQWCQETQSNLAKGKDHPCHLTLKG